MRDTFSTTASHELTCVPGSSWRRRRGPIDHTASRARPCFSDTPGTAAALPRSSRHSRFGTLMPQTDRSLKCSRAGGFVSSHEWTQRRSMATMSRDGSMLVARHARFFLPSVQQAYQDFPCTVCSWRNLRRPGPPSCRRPCSTTTSCRRAAREIPRPCSCPDVRNHGCPPRLLKKEFRNPETSGKKTNMFHSLFFVDLCEGPGSQRCHCIVLAQIQVLHTARFTLSLRFQQLSAVRFDVNAFIMCLFVQLRR